MKASREDRLLAALITHKTVRDAAKAAGIPERTAFDMLSKPNLSARYAELKDDIIRGAAAEVRNNMTAAAKTVISIMTDSEAPPPTRLAAAKLVLDNGLKLTEQEDILDRIARLEEKAESRQ